MVENNKALFCWGKNDKHQMARGYTSTIATPDAVFGLIAGRDNAVLAPGLTFNNSNGMITGTPTTENQDPVELNIYACNGRGCDSTLFNYSIWDRPEVGLINIETIILIFQYHLLRFTRAVQSTSASMLRATGQSRITHGTVSTSTV